MSGSKDDTIAARISEALAERIISGTLKPGARLRQGGLASEFAVSQAPVREAFRRLEAQGLVVSEPRRGVRVAAFDLKEVSEVAEMRAVLEALALRHAAPHLTPALLDEAEIITKEGDASRDLRSWEAANRAFHRLIASPCGMPRLLASIDDLHAASARFLFSAWRAEWEARTDFDHRAIIEALRRGQTEAAISTLERHVRRVTRRPIDAAGGGRRDAFAIAG